MLSYEQQKEAINMAMQIETGTADLDYILNRIASNHVYGVNLLEFWLHFNQMTRNALRQLTYHKCRLHLEKCMEKDL